MQNAPLHANPIAAISRTRPDHPVAYFCPDRLQATAGTFQRGFPGLVTYAVKANSNEAVLGNLVTAGIDSFDVASPAEIDAVRAICPSATLHYNNPVRSPEEIACGVERRVSSWSVDHPEELEKLREAPRGEVAVRFALPVVGAAYDFGEKFGAVPAVAAQLLRQAADMGFVPSLCFHPGTQCSDPKAWQDYIVASARIAGMAGLRIQRLNVGGGFAANRGQGRPVWEDVFDTIQRATCAAFEHPPELLCEPGRAMVAGAFDIAVRVKARRGDTLYLNDGIYGGLTELRDIGHTRLVSVCAPCGSRRQGRSADFTAFGPTCDSLDRLPEGLTLPADIAAGDYVIFGGMGAYSLCLTTRFNGYGLQHIETVARLTGHPG